MPQDNTANQLVVFSLAEHEYALEIARVQEIIQYQAPSPVAADGGWIRGVIDLRGKIVPVCDLAVRLGFTDTEATTGIILIVDTADGSAGFIVDQVQEVLATDPEQHEPAPAAAADFIAGIAKIEDRLVMLLDPAALIADGALSAA
jgi:purine-binding chemotaxis protein CheW